MILKKEKEEITSVMGLFPICISLVSISDGSIQRISKRNKKKQVHCQMNRSGGVSCSPGKCSRRLTVRREQVLPESLQRNSGLKPACGWDRKEEPKIREFIQTLTTESLQQLPLLTFLSSYTGHAAYYFPQL